MPLLKGKKNIGKNIKELQADNKKKGKERGANGKLRSKKQILARLIVTGKQTMAIIKEGPIFKIFPAAAIPSGSIHVEFISKHIGTATQ